MSSVNFLGSLSFVSFLVLFFLFLCQCPVTCGGGVRSRTVTCTLAPKKTCDPSTKPRSRSLCGLQSCPNTGLRRQPGPPPKYRRIIPRKRQPTTLPASSTWAPSSTTSSAAPTTAITVTVGSTITQTAAAFIPDTTSPRIPETARPEIRDIEDGLVNVSAGGNSDWRGKGPLFKTSDARTAGTEQEMAEEGSTPNVVAYTPGYDYVVEERMTEEEGIIDLDVTTSASHKGPLQSSTPTPTPGPATPTLQTTETTTAQVATEAVATYTPSKLAATGIFVLTPGRNLLDGPTHTHSTTAAATTHGVKPHGYTTTLESLAVTTTAIPTDQPLGPSTAPPPTTVRKPVTTITTITAPHSTIKTIRTKKPSAGTKNPSTWSKSIRPKNSKQQQQPRSFGSSSFASNQSDLLAKEPVSLNIFWVIGKWSEVGGKMFTTTLSSLLKHHTSKFSCFSPLTAQLKLLLAIYQATP